MRKIHPVPRSLNWVPAIPQTHECNKSTLLTSGCSFTMPFWLDGPDTWPGFVKDRCRFKQCIDYSWTGLENRYIKDSIIFHVDKLIDFSDILVVVVWTGLNRELTLIRESEFKGYPEFTPKLGDTYYSRCGSLSASPNEFSEERRVEMANENAQHIFELRDYLTARKIPFVFSTYVNLLYPPFLPKRDQTHHFCGYVDVKTLQDLKSIITVPSDPMEYMYEFGFVNDLLQEQDMFHPTMNCAERWVDRVLLPGLTAQGLITKI